MAATLVAVSPTMTLSPTPDFADFYRSEWRRVLSLVYVLSGSAWGAEDIAQDAFLRAHRNWDEVGRYERPDAWVRTVALNLARSRVRRAGAELRALRRWVGLQASSFPEMEPVSEEFWAAVRALPQRQREVVALHYAEDRPVKDIAAVLGVAESTVKTSLQKGREALARRLERMEDTP
jgi:RNA polymerase sigma-70 factor (ECF subfamily)